MQRILSDVNASAHRAFLSGDNNFRYEIFPQYKANRIGKPKPKHLELVKEHLVREWNAEITEGMEADDALGIHQMAYFSDDPEFGATPYDCCICSIDKDLLQIPGQHYNFVKQEISDITIDQGWYNFYFQVLLGDPSDNIRGCKGIGKAKAPKILDGRESLYLACWEAYQRAGQTLVDLELACQLLYILRREEDKWTPPVTLSENAETASKSESSENSMDSSLGLTKPK